MWYDNALAHCLKEMNKVLNKSGSKIAKVNGTFVIGLGSKGFSTTLEIKNSNVGLFKLRKTD